jgi:hypothetical protein
MIWIFVFCLLPWVTQAFTISGTVTGGGLIRVAAAVPVEADTFYVGFVLPFVNTYSITVPAGNYIVAAFEDVNGNLEIDPGEPIGWWGGDFPDIVVVNSNISGINISLAVIDNGSFSGMLSYGGSLSGASFVRAFDNPELAGDPVGGGLIFNNQTGNGIYVGLTTSLGTFWAESFLDMNGNLLPDPGEPYGVYGGDAPQSFDILSDIGPTDIDIALVDPVVPRVENLTVSINGNDAVLRWSFGDPFTEFQVYRTRYPNVHPADDQFLGTTTNMNYTDISVVSIVSSYRYTVIVIF